MTRASVPALRGDGLPAWRRVLAVVAHPDDESFGLGALLDAFVRSGAEVSVLCLTHGEASTLGGPDGGLAAVREGELRAAAEVLGIRHTALRDHPDGGLASLDRLRLAEEVAQEAGRTRAEGLLVFDPLAGVTGHPDHEAASRAAMLAGEERGLPVVGWALPEAVAAALRAETGAGFAGHPLENLHAVEVDRTRQLAAVRCHASQAVPGSVLWRRLELLGDAEYLRRLVASTGPAAGTA
ncbi:PIG-L family deacetylase [Phycicoccus endophyticus]|uniref:PIG-L family deacetylase n=1 Tax=Phycicoccus endophyticus TaxID=1690220 RepID=A0A7G9R0G7_9MICO|nr:PIG-L deacetylase family protein [Phycicoccus endophyticus]NHI19365.1 PIG-L family deacetylase [Phycicoccus endophyticus]QNN49092.1 PIG-L family deacetylase [Phycicoccus endophyticus]GGL38504.1 PIG-L domain-containing protein [Phycicoccus endophyticus]